MTFTQQHALAEAVVHVRTTRAQTASLAAEVATLMQAWEQQHATILEQLAASRGAQQEAERQARDLGIQLYQPGSSKQLMPGISIRERIELVYDPAEALLWAQAGNQLAITPACLNVEAFERLARQFPSEVPFVQQHVTYQVLLSKTL